MRIFEYIGKELFNRFGLPVPKGKVVSCADEAALAAAEIGPVVVKAQILSGKRGKSGGIRFANTPAEAKSIALELLGANIRGYLVEKLLVEEKLAVDQEFYLAVTIDEEAKSPVIIASNQGGIDIEEVPENRILKVHTDAELGMYPFIARNIVRRLGLDLGSQHGKELVKAILATYQVFQEKDAVLVEINPLVFSGEKIFAADAKVIIDPEARFRQKDIPYVEDQTETEKLAHDLGLSYVELKGDIAVMANGAGIAMSTLDILMHYGGTPANFLDVVGGTDTETIARSLEILLAKKPKVIFINIFGGSTRCDDVARAYVKVKKKGSGIQVPVVIRLEGTNQDKGRRILQECGIEAYTDMEEAAAKAVELAACAPAGSSS